MFNIEGGCYAKCIGLKQETEPEIFNAIRWAGVAAQQQASRSGGQYCTVFGGVGVALGAGGGTGKAPAAAHPMSCPSAHGCVDRWCSVAMCYVLS